MPSKISKLSDWTAGAFKMRTAGVFVDSCVMPTWLRFEKTKSYFKAEYSNRLEKVIGLNHLICTCFWQAILYRLRWGHVLVQKLYEGEFKCLVKFLKKGKLCIFTRNSEDFFLTQTKIGSQIFEESTRSDKK